MDSPQINDPELIARSQDAAYDNDLISVDAVGGDLMPQMDDKQLAAVSSSGDFLPRLQLFGGNSDACKKGQIQIAHYGLVTGKDTIEDMGKEVDIIVICGRPKALRICDDGTIITKFDPNDDEFKKIMEDSNVADSGCMYGPEFMVFVPDVQRFATFFMSSKTARRSAASVHARLRKAATLKAEFIETKKYSWHGPVCVPCSSPMSAPSNEDIAAAVKKFTSAKESSVETVAAPAAGDAGTARAR